MDKFPKWDEIDPIKVNRGTNGPRRTGEEIESIIMGWANLPGGN